MEISEVPPAALQTREASIANYFPLTLIPKHDENPIRRLRGRIPKRQRRDEDEEGE
jgi:hypothetical protein